MDLFQMIPVRSVLYPEHLEKNRPSHTGPALLSSAGFSQQISIFHYSKAYTSSSTPVLIIAKTNKYQDTRTLFPIIFKIFINHQDSDDLIGKNRWGVKVIRPDRFAVFHRMKGGHDNCLFQ